MSKETLEVGGSIKLFASHTYWQKEILKYASSITVISFFILYNKVPKYGGYVKSTLSFSLLKATNELLDLCMRDLVFYILNIYTDTIWNTVYISIITDIVTVWNFEIIPKKFNMDEFCTSANNIQESLSSNYY